MYKTGGWAHTRNRLAKALLLVGMLCLWSLPSSADTIYQKIRVPTPQGADRARFFFHPDLEVMGEADGYLILLSRPELTEGLRERGFPVEVLVADLQAYYEAQAAHQQGYGVWHTYDETVAEMNLIHTEYPSITTAPSSIGTTGQGRTIWAMKVSDNPAVQENEPEVLFDGVHHAREIMTVEDVLHFIRYLCENYTSDPVVNFLVNNRQIWFVPIVNVDGFVYNQQIAPNGGGMWRKNRSLDPNSGCYGVDNNRNYIYQWVGGGSSTNPCDDTYRGPAAGSEQENKAMMRLINAHHFVTWQSYHSAAGMVLFPWGYTNQHTSDDATFRAVAARMARQSGYLTGQPGEILYNVNGDSFDWGYGDALDHPKIFAFTTEIGGSGFWPQPSEKPGLISENLESDIYVCQAAGTYLELTATSVVGGNNNGRLDPGESASIVVTVRNPGLILAAANVQATLLCQDPYLALNSAVSSLGNIAAGGSSNSGTNPFAVTVDPSCPPGHTAGFIVRLTANGGLQMDQSVQLDVGQAPVLYADTFEQPGSEWAQDPTHNAQRGAFVRVAPVATNFQPGTDTTPDPGVNAWITAQNPNGQDDVDDVDNGISATRSPVIDLSSATHARLDLNYFFGQKIEGDDAVGDFFRVDVSNDGGTTFPVNLVQIGDVHVEPAWRNLKVDLEELLPLTSRMAFRVQVSDGTAAADIIEGGVDDVYVYNRGNGDQPPSSPVLLSPPDGAGDQPASPTLVVQNASDPEGDLLTYGFRVYADVLLTHLVASADGVPGGAGGSTSWVVSSALDDGTYYWRAYAADPYGRGLYMTPASFTVTGVSSAPALAGEDRSFVALPNPSAGAVRIRYHTPATPASTLEIFDPSGRRVRSLDGARWSSGWQQALWDGRDEGGARLPAGVYWIRLVLPRETRAVRIIRLP